MLEAFFSWALSNWVEITGTVFGLAYIYFSIKQHILTWPIGLITSALYIYVFFVSKFYADMALQAYYVWVSIYGWVLWRRGSGIQKTEKALEVTKTGFKMWMGLLLVSIALSVAIYFILSRYTDSPVPIGDALTTGFSIVATWMLARKKLEHWILWVLIDAFSMGLYLYKGLYATTILFAVYTVAAVVGYIEWRKTIKPVAEHSLV
jgi:nicotinamide mononucleotide transporter